MDRRIFDQGLSVEAVSLYVLMCSLADGGAVVRRETAQPMWNATETELDSAIAELAAQSIARVEPNGDWVILPGSLWKKAGEA